MQLGSIYLKDKEAAIPEVRRWLLDTYKVVPGSMVPKKQVYDAYRAFCASCDFEPSDVSSFGKIFKRVFPDVERKRLVKGWHYNNLAPRANDTTSSLSSSTPSAGGTEDSSPATAPGDRLYHSDPVVPTASSRGGARRHLATRPLSPPPPRPHSRSASPVSGATTHFTTSFTAIPTARSRSPSPSSAIVRRAHSQSPVSSSHHIRTRAHAHTAPLLSPAPLRPTTVSPHLFHPLPLYHPPPSNLQPHHHQLPQHPPAPPHQQQHHQPYPLTQHAIFHHHQHHPSYSPQPLPLGHQYHPQAWAGPPQQLPANAMAGASYSPSLGPLLEAAGHHHVRRNRSRPHGPAEVEMAEGGPSSGAREDPSGAATATTMPTTTTTTTPTPTLAPSSSPGTSMLDAWAVSAGTHMQLTSELEYYVSVYQREMWGLHPVNPAALGTELLQYLQTTEDGARERTPLTMCSLFALSMGCTLAGDFRRGREYLNKLRLQVSQLFDESNYDVACVLRHLPLLVRFYAETEQDRENSAYYLTLSQQICAHIGAVNDENYLITLKMLSIYERLDIDDKITAALSQPRWRKRWAIDYPFIENYKYGKLTEMARDYLYEISKNVLLLLDPPSTYASPKPLHDGIIEQLSRIDEWETSVSDLQETYGAIHTLRLVRAAIFLLRTTCHTAIHQTDDALESATDFVQLLLELMRPYQIVCCIELSSKTVYMRSLIQTLLHAGRYDQIQELTELALSLAQEFGAINAFCQFLLDSLSAHQHRLRGGAPPSSPMTSSMPSPSVTLMITSAPPSPPSVTVPPPPLPSFPLYTTPHAMPTLPPLLLPPGLHDPSASSSSSSSPSSASSSSISSTPVPQHYSSSMPSMIAPERPEDHHDVETLHAYLSSFLDQNM